MTNTVFYVFRAGPELTSITLELSEGGPQGSEVAKIGHVHVHEGAELAFGARLLATQTTEFGGTWAVQPGAIYVLEVATEFGGFF